MVRVPTMGIIKCQEFIGEKAVAVTLSLVSGDSGGLIISVTFLPTPVSVYRKVMRQTEKIIDIIDQRELN